MIVPRLAFLALAAATAIGLVLLAAPVLGAGGWTAPKAAILLCFLGVAPWLGRCVGNAVLGFGLLLLARSPARTVLPVAGAIGGAPITARAAIALAVRHEDMAAVPPLGRLLEGLAAAGVADRFAAFVLSDSADPAFMAAEEAAVAAFPQPQRRPLPASAAPLRATPEFARRSAPARSAKPPRIIRAGYPARTRA
jgi:membrane glycosyltransferase